MIFSGIKDFINKKVFHRLSVWVTFLFILSTLVPLGFFGLTTYQAAMNGLEDELGKRLVTVARLTAHDLERENLRALVERGAMTRALEKRLQNLAWAAQVKGLILLSRDKKVILDSEGQSEFGEDFVLLNLDLAEWRRAEQGLAVSSPLFTGRDGRLYKSAYAPVFGPTGEWAGMIRAEASAEFLSVVRQFGLSLLVFGVASVILALVLAAWVSRPLLGPVQGLIKAAKRIAGGDFDVRVEPRRRDEIGLLTLTFNEMAQQLGDFVRNKERLATLGELSAGVAHEIRNPLGAIEGFAGLLLANLKETDPSRKHALDIQSEVRILNRFLTDFLEYARPAPVTTRTVDLGEVVKSAWNVVFPQTQGMRWRMDRQGLTQLSIETDDEQLRRVMVNLIRNAKEASPRGGIILVGLEQRKGEAALWVEDHGRGITPGDLKQLFVPFFTTKPMGTGLGLAIADKIVKSFSGKIEVESQAGKGSRFTVLLPSGRA
jgi:signal transduction histidine kinase